MTEKTQMGQVPCGSCSRCCRKFHMVALMPQHGEKAEDYDTVTVGDVTMLRFKENGDCVYLDENGKCSIHGRAPIVCRSFDCRVVFVTSTRVERRKMMKHGHESAEVYKAGRERADTLDMDAPEIKEIQRRGGLGELTFQRAMRYSGRMRK